MTQSNQVSQLRAALESAYDRRDTLQVKLLSRQIDAIAVRCVMALCASAPDPQACLAGQA